MFAGFTEIWYYMFFNSLFLEQLWRIIIFRESFFILF